MYGFKNINDVGRIGNAVRMSEGSIFPTKDFGNRRRAYPRAKSNRYSDSFAVSTTKCDGEYMVWVEGGFYYTQTDGGESIGDFFDFINENETYVYIEIYEDPIMGLMDEIIYTQELFDSLLEIEYADGEVYTILRRPLATITKDYKTQALVVQQEQYGSVFFSNPDIYTGDFAVFDSSIKDNGVVTTCQVDVFGGNVEFGIYEETVETITLPINESCYICLWLSCNEDDFYLIEIDSETEDIREDDEWEEAEGTAEYIKQDIAFVTYDELENRITKIEQIQKDKIVFSGRVF